MNTAARVAILLVTATSVFGCTDGGRMDYGTPAAQFLEEDLATKGQSYVGQKITVKGTVEKRNVADSGNSSLLLNGGIRCNFGKFEAMVESCKLGDTVYIDGILKKCNDDGVLIEPAMLRDSTAPFDPK